MSGDLEYIIFDFASFDTLSDRSNILQLINTLVQSDFTPCRFPELVTVVDTPEALMHILDEVKTNSGGVIIDCRNSKGFEVSLGIPDHLQQLIVTVDNGCISDVERAHYDRVRSLVRICELVYNSLHPDYGRGFVSPSVHPFAFEDPSQQTGTVQAVHDYNFFGPNLVQRFGRRKMLSVPAWRTTEFSDGGILLEMSPNPIADWESYTSNYETTTQILGLEGFYQGG
jgi:hypothetical protein